MSPGVNGLIESAKVYCTGLYVGHRSRESWFNFNGSRGS